MVELHFLVPAYGPSPYLSETLASLAAAADDRCAVTVVDDGSPGTQVAGAAAAAGVEYVRLPANKGVAGAFQRCAELSRGGYTVLVGSDDVVEPSYVAAVLDLAERFSRPAMLLPGVRVIDGEGRPALPLADRVKQLLAPSGQVPRLLYGDRLVASLLTGNWLYFPAIAWRTDLLREYGFRRDMQTALDLDLELRLLFGGERLAWSGEPAFRYRRHPSSASSRTAGSGVRFEEERQIFAWAHDEATARGWARSSLAARVHATARVHRGLTVLSGRVSRSGRRDG